MELAKGWESCSYKAMLILSRKVNENIVIDGRIVVKIVRLDGENVKLGIEAPPDVLVFRQEVWDDIQANLREGLPPETNRRNKTALTLARKKRDEELSPPPNQT